MIYKNIFEYEGFKISSGKKNILWMQDHIRAII